MRMNAYRYLFYAANKIVWQTGDIADYLNRVEALHDLFPQYSKLQFGHSVAHTAVYPKPKSDMRPRVWPIYDQPVGVFENAFISISG